MFDDDPDVSVYLKKATDIFKRLIILFDDDEFTDSVGVSLTIHLFRFFLHWNSRLKVYRTIKQVHKCIHFVLIYVVFLLNINLCE